MKFYTLAAAKAASKLENIKLSHRSKRKIRRAANHTIDAAVSVAADVMKGFRKEKH
jgi:hypothetical protein